MQASRYRKSERYQLREPNKKASRHILITMTKTIHKDTMLKSVRSKISQKGTSLRFIADFSNETFPGWSQWWDIVKNLNEMKTSPRIPTSVSFIFEEVIHKIMDKQYFRNFVDSKPILKDIKGPH